MSKEDERNMREKLQTSYKGVDPMKKARLRT